MPTPQAVFNGTYEEAQELLAAFKRYCECEHNEQTGQVIKRCAAHKAMIEDQRMLNGLIFMRRRREILEKEEKGRANNSRHK